MERGGFHGYRKLSPNTISGPKFFVSDAGMRLPEFSQSNNNAMIVSNAANGDDECMVREQDRFMPIANVIRIMRRILPPHAKISDDAKETIQECVSEYISFITGEANERCQREQRKTITAEDVLWAMSKLGFDDYIEPLTRYLHRYRELEGERGSGCTGGSMISMSSGLVMKRPNGMVADYGVYGAGLHLAHHYLRMSHQSGFAFGGYDVNPNFKDGGAAPSTAAPPAAGVGSEVSPYEQDKYRG